MDLVHLHLLVTHVPIFAAIFSLAILIWAMMSRHPEHFKIAFTGFIIAGIFAVIAYYTGEGSEDIAESIAGISHDSIERHEDVADLALWMTGILGIFGIIGLILNKLGTRGFRAYSWIILIYGLLTAIVLAYTANLGGQIRHTEISQSTVSQYQVQIKITLSTNTEEADAHWEHHSFA